MRRAYHRAKQQGLVAQDLSPNEIQDGEQPYGFTLTEKGGEAGLRKRYAAGIAWRY